jgi:hypothetical protein
MNAAGVRDMTTNLIAAVVLSGRPTFGQHLTLTQILVIAAWLFCQRLSVMTTDHLEHLLREAVADGFRRAHLTVEQAAAIMRMDYFNLQKALKGERGRAIPIDRLFRLPLTFWTSFLPDLVYLVAKKSLMDVVDGAQDVRRVS